MELLGLFAFFGIIFMLFYSLGPIQVLCAFGGLLLAVVALVILYIVVVFIVSVIAGLLGK